LILNNNANRLTRATSDVFFIFRKLSLNPQETITYQGKKLRLQLISSKIQGLIVQSDVTVIAMSSNLTRKNALHA